MCGVRVWCDMFVVYGICAVVCGVMVVCMEVEVRVQCGARVYCICDMFGVYLCLVCVWCDACVVWYVCGKCGVYDVYACVVCLVYVYGVMCGVCGVWYLPYGMWGNGGDVCRGGGECIV